MTGKENIKIESCNHDDRSLCFTHIHGKLWWSTGYIYTVISQYITSKKDF